jgi:predicted DNA-binding transcriptional regulator AlpA
MHDDELDEVLRIDGVKRATGMCKSEIYERMATDPDFPQNFQLEEGGRAVGWSKRELIAYQKARKATREKTTSTRRGLETRWGR